MLASPGRPRLSATIKKSEETAYDKALEKEELVEYVFGEVQKTEVAGSIVVPYASKSYYDKHGKYSLKMVLSNKKSAKGRYYIVSGN